MEFSWDLFFGIRTGFKAFSIYHGIPVLFFTFITWYWIREARKWPERKQFSSALFFSLVLAFSILFWMAIKIATNRFDIAVDLPFHLCNLLGIIFPFALYYRKRWFFGILYFFVLVGTFQAVLTPELQEPFPHYIYFRYWLLHCGLISLVFYCLYVLQWKIYPGDIWKSIVGANIYLLFSLIINYFVGGNYFYSMGKPNAASLLDYLGPWPWYLVTGQFVMIGFFILYYLPIHIKNRKKTSRQASSAEF